MTLYMGLASIKSKYFEEFPDKLLHNSIEVTIFAMSKLIQVNNLKTQNYESNSKQFRKFRD